MNLFTELYSEEPVTSGKLIDEMEKNYQLYF